MRPLSYLHIGIAASALAFGLLAAPATAQCVVNCDFSISPNKGRFIEEQVTPAILAKSDAAITNGLTNGRALNDSSINKGGNAGSGLRMPLTEQALTAMLDGIARQWPYRSPGPVSVRITASTSFSPIAKPDNVIVVPLGLLMQAKDDDVVAWVLAHEYAHIALAHFSREARQRALSAGADRLVACTRTAMALSELRPSNSGGKLNFVREKNEHTLAMSQQTLLRGDNLADLLEVYNQQLSKTQEDQADAAGLDMALKAGYSDSGFGDALIVVEDEEKRAGTLLQSFTRALGSSAKTAASGSLKQAMNGNIGEALKNLQNSMFRNAIVLLENKAIEMMKQSHRPAKKRREGLSKYVDGAWQNTEFPEPRHTWIDVVRATPEYVEAQTAVQALDNSDAAKAEIGLSDPAASQFAAQRAAALAKAIAAIQPALKTRYFGTPIVANSMAGLMVVAQQLAQADRYYDLAAAAPLAQKAAVAPVVPARRGAKVARKPAASPALPVAEGVPDIYLQQSLSGFDHNVDFLVHQRNYPKSLKVIALAKTRFGDDDKFLPYLVTIYTQTGQKDLLLATIGRCTASEDKQLQQRCMIAMADPAQADKIAQLPPMEQDVIYAKLNAVYADAKMGSSCGLTDFLKKADREPGSLTAAL